MNDLLERRTFVGAIQLRSAPAGSTSPGTLVGYGAVFRQLSQDLGGFREQIAPGAFLDCLRTDDVRALKNHDENLILGRNIAGTLRMTEDDHGLSFECDLPNTTTGRDTAEEILRGDMSGCSFSFTTDVDEWDMQGAIPIRTVRKVRQLFDVGPVTFPAYTQTEVACRSLRTAKAALSKSPEPIISLLLAKARQRLAEMF